MSGNEGSDKEEIAEKSIITLMPENFGEEASDVDDALPEKSRIVYNNAYNKFTEWKKNGGNKPMSEQLMLNYFVYLFEVQKRKPSTLWSIYSMLKLTIKTNDKINIGKFRKLNAYLKEQSIGFESKKTKSLTSSDIENFLNDAPDKRYLAVKVSLIFAIIGSCRREELCNITVSDIEDDGTFALIKIRNPETEVERSFTIVDEFYSIYKKYAVLRPKWAKTDRFFMQYMDGKCTQQVIGINKFGSMPKLIASWLKLPDPESYTGHSFRRSSAILLADSGADLSSIRANSEFKTKIAKCHAKNSINRKKKLSEQIMKTVILKSNSKESSTPVGLRPSTSLSPAFFVPTSSTSTSATSSTSAINFETIYFPLKEECADDNNEISQEENPLREKNKTELSRKSGNTSKQSNIQAESSVASKKGVKPPVSCPQRKVLRPGTSVSTQVPVLPPVPVLAPLTQSQGSPKTLYLRTIIPKGGSGNPATVNPPVKQAIIERSQDGGPIKQQIIRKPQDGSSVKQPIIQISQDATLPKSAGVCLRWKSYHSNMQNSFPSLLDSEEFVDVTLACEGKSVKCHKIILSSCSDYLAQLLRENPCPHPIILMKDLKFWEIEAIVKFMYNGETHVPHEQLPELLKAAKALGIKGLAGFTLAKVLNKPAAVPQPKPQTPQKSALPEVQKPSNPPSTQASLIQMTKKRAPKRPSESTETRPLVKIRLQRAKSPILRAESPEIKYEPIDLPPSPIDDIPDDNYDDIAEDFIDLEEMHDDDDVERDELMKGNDAADPGGDEMMKTSDAADPGGEELMKSSDDADDNEKVEFVGNEFLTDEDILDVIDRESCRSSPLDDTTIGEISADNILRIMNDDSLEEESVEDDNFLTTNIIKKMWRYKNAPREHLRSYRIKKQNDPEPLPSQSTFLFDIEMDLSIKTPRSKRDNKSDVIRTALTISTAKMMSRHSDWSPVGTILLNRLRKYIKPEDTDWKFEITEKSREYWNYEKQVQLARHCAPIRDTREYPQTPFYDEINFADVFGENVEFSFTMKLFLGPAIFGAHEKYEERGFLRTSPWYGDSTDEDNFPDVMKIFTSKRKKSEVNRYREAWTLVMEVIDCEQEDFHDHGYY